VTADRSTSTSRRAAIRSAALVLALAVLGGGGLIVLRPRSTAAAAGVVEIHAAHGSSFVPALQGKRPLFILVLGSDARPGQNVERQRADSIHILGVNARAHRATLLGFPRDSWVPIPGFGTNKINTAMADGGPRLLIRTIENLTGIRIDFWMLTNFSGLTSMVNGVGGLTVDVPFRMHDKYSGAFFKPGRHHFNGKNALAFSRDRHDFLNGDITRSKNQGRILLAALSALQKRFAKDPAAVLEWIATDYRFLRTDLDVQTLVDLGLTATRVPLGHVTNLVVPATSGVVGAADVVFISSSARALYAQMRKHGTVG
jgi:LCP family protein required for cell wall assembly